MTPELAPISYADFAADVARLAEHVRADAWMPDRIVGIGRGGLAPALWLSHACGVAMLSLDLSSGDPGFADTLVAAIATRAAAGERFLLIDDINDSGRTIAGLRAALAGGGANIRFAVLIDNVASPERPEFFARSIDRRTDKRWLVFPWEAMASAATLTADANAVPERLG